MVDIENLKQIAECAIFSQKDIGSSDIYIHFSAKNDLFEFTNAASPQTVLELIAEIERLNNIIEATK